LFVCLLAVGVFSVSIDVNHHNTNKNKEERRLISLNETYATWMSQSEIEHLMAKRIHFMDITDRPENPPTATIAASPIPTAIAYRPLVQSLLPLIQQSQITTVISILGNSFQTRYYTSTTGVSSATWIRDRFLSYRGSRTDIAVELFSHTWAQPSVIARILGSGPNSKELVILGAHEDSVGTSSTARSPGADDDASGVATVLEAFRVIVNSGFKPDRTLEFMTYAAEEVGLRGSQAIANSYASQAKDVRSVLQFDMTGYHRTSRVVGVMTDYTDTALTSFLRLLVTNYTTLQPTDIRCGYACSDHASWYNARYRAAYPFESTMSDSNPNIHTASDTLSNLNITHAAEFVKIAVGYSIELAGQA